MLFISDAPDGIAQVSPDGKITRLGDIEGVPNGHAMDAKGNLIVTDIENGRLWRIGRDGSQDLLYDSLEGTPLGAVNFAMADARGAIWISVSTRTVPRQVALSDPRPDGYILRIRDGRAELVADGFYFTNEIRLNPSGTFLYVAETAKGRVCRLPILSDDSLGEQEVFGPDPLFAGARVDGITFDVEGNLWLTELSRNSLHLLTPEGEAYCIFEDLEGQFLQTPTSLTFAGSDLRTVYVGSLAMTSLVTFRSPVAGFPLSHWKV